jgi:hypothetical protein
LLENTALNLMLPGSLPLPCLGRFWYLEEYDLTGLPADCGLDHLFVQMRLAQFVCIVVVWLDVNGPPAVLIKTRLTESITGSCAPI